MAADRQNTHAMRPSAALDLSRYQFAEMVVRDYAPRLMSKHVFDIGAGGGTMREPVSKLGLHWHGFDLDPSAPDIRQWNLHDRCPDMDSGPGIVLMLEVIEHLYNPGLAIGHVAEIMNRGTILVVTTPNPRWSRSRLHAVLTGYPACFNESDLYLNHHVFTAWPHVVEHLLTISGFAVERYVTLDGSYSWPKFAMSLRYPIGMIHAAANKLIEWRDPSACGMSYAVVARRT